MDYKYIEQLLERYWECQTSAAEESILHAFFTQEEVPAHLAQYKSLFEYMEVAEGVEVLGEDFDKKMLKLVILTNSGRLHRKRPAQKLGIPSSLKNFIIFPGIVKPSRQISYSILR